MTSIEKASALFPVYPLFPITPVKGEGAYVFDEQGQRYLDFYGGHAVISIGHSHPKYVAAIQEQLLQLGFYSNSVQNPLQEEFAQKLTQLSNCPDYRLFLCNSGAEANENALKLASFYTGKTKVLAFEKAFHGRTSAAVNATDNPKIKAPINQSYPIEFLPWNDLTATRQALGKGDVAALIIEGIQGVGGIQVPCPDFLEQIAQLCQEHDVILILDEVQSGYGRTGRFFAYQFANIQPDLITIAKGMGNGFPIAGLLIHPRFEARYGLLGTTFGGNHLACAAGIAVLDIMVEEQLMVNAIYWGDYLIKELRQYAEIVEVRGRGLMLGLEMTFPVADLRRQMVLEDHVFTGSSSDPNVLRLLPPLSIGASEVDQLLSTLQKRLKQYA